LSAPASSVPPAARPLSAAEVERADAVLAEAAEQARAINQDAQAAVPAAAAERLRAERWD
jgi:hypothetical protein